ILILYNAACLIDFVHFNLIMLGASKLDRIMRVYIAASSTTVKRRKIYNIFLGGIMEDEWLTSNHSFFTSMQFLKAKKRKWYWLPQGHKTIN
ncbi:hypothetical protein ACJX0J_023505, partial [Zea mays]